jgi:translocation and assembly module TamB
LLGVLTLLVVGNTRSGRQFIERTTGQLTHGQVQLQGLAGRFPDRLRVDHLLLKDNQGLWLQADELQLDSSPLELLGKVARVDLLHAGKLSIPRAPDYGPQSQALAELLRRHVVSRVASGSTGSATRVELGAALAGAPVALRMQASARVYSLAARLGAVERAAVGFSAVAV